MYKFPKLSLQLSSTIHATSRSDYLCLDLQFVSSIYQFNFTFTFILHQISLPHFWTFYKYINYTFYEKRRVTKRDFLQSFLQLLSNKQRQLTETITLIVETQPTQNVRFSSVLIKFWIIPVKFELRNLQLLYGNHHQW